ncbi:MAG TPA: LysM peptidoglycan-binding domain-containing protein [Candidatus Ligilactobacillus excrementipullorum]|nr:LysM peptidoglycan-binding domain-containing protein [Candidatus Ligilactobacillus excrementipullorum]
MKKNIKQTLLSLTAAAGLFAAGSVAANADTVTVKAGDTVSDIALAHHTTVAAIEKANKLADVNFILPGQKLEIDKKGNVKVVEQPQQTQAAIQQQQAPAAAQTPAAQPQQQAPVQQAQAPVAQAQPQQRAAQPQRSTANVSGSEAAARQFIMARESSGDYNARNGIYIGAYQLSSDKLNGDYSRANQDRVAQQYVTARYGSWQAAQQYWNAHHSY